jgi:bacteriocin biosynthesis cyclodehydratase domain-containing protein
MVLKLDPRIPIVWRNPDTLQVGVDAPLMVFTDVTIAEQRVIAALVGGVSRSGLDMISRSGGGVDLDGLLAGLEPALIKPRPATSIAVTIEGTGPTAEEITRLLGHLVQDAATATPGTGFAVIVADHVIDPRQHGGWLRRDIPHLPVVFGDLTVRIGPLVEPGSGPCLYCLELHRTDADPAWPAIAAQLLGRRSATETLLVAREVAAMATRVVLERIERGAAEGSSLSGSSSIDLDVHTGARTVRSWARHPDCGCSGLGAADRLGAAPREIGTASVPAPDPSSFSPTTGEGVSAHA